MAKNKKMSFKINATEILLNRSGKVDGRIAEVRTGCGVHEDRRFKKPKYKQDWGNY